MSPNPSIRKFVDFAMYVLLCLVWGSTWLVIKVGYGGLGPFNVAALRFVAAGAVSLLTVAIGLIASRGVGSAPPLEILRAEAE